MHHPQPNNPLHGITLKEILTALVEFYGWERLGQLIDIKCFQNEPSVSSSLVFLRKQDWARKELEELYIRCVENNDIVRPNASV